MQLWAVRKYAGISCRDGADTGAGQCGVVKQDAGLVATRKHEGVGKGHASFGIRMNGLDRFAVGGCYHILRLVGVRSGTIFCQCQPAINGDR